MGSHEHGEGVTDADFDLVTQIHREFVQSYVGRYTNTERETCIALTICFVGSNFFELTLCVL